eukprot:7045110-Prymnesium_polylepis.1
MLGLTFLVVPSTATRIFKTFLCDAIEYDEVAHETRSYLHDDLYLDCGSTEYHYTRNTAIAMLLVWPVGVPLMYSVLLWRSRSAHLTGIPTPLSRATTFLSGDYTEAAFWWEPLEMCRKLTLCGWVLLISEEYEQGRALVALLVSIAFLTIRLSVKPLRRVEDTALMVFVDLVLVCICRSCRSISRTQRYQSQCEKSHVRSPARRCVCLAHQDLRGIVGCVRHIRLRQHSGRGAPTRSTPGGRAWPFSTCASLCAAQVYLFFIFFGLSMILVQLIISLVNLYVTGNVPHVILIARSHSVSPSSLFWKVSIRKARMLKRQLLHKLRLDVPRLSPAAAVAIFKFRAARGRIRPADSPAELVPILVGEHAELSVKDVFPRTACFVLLDITTIALRWSRTHFLCLRTVSNIEQTKVPPALLINYEAQGGIPRVCKMEMAEDKVA